MTNTKIRQKNITLSHGNGVKVMQDLINDVFIPLTEDGRLLLEEEGDDLLFAAEVMVDETVRDARFTCDVGDARAVIALAGEHLHGGVGDQAPLGLGGGRAH